MIYKWLVLYLFFFYKIWESINILLLSYLFCFCFKLYFGLVILYIVEGIVCCLIIILCEEVFIIVNVEWVYYIICR